MTEIFFYATVFLCTYFGVAIFRRWSLQRKLLDIPNERSSHTKPTPRGGGFVIVVVCLVFYLIYTLFFTQTFSWSYFIGAILIALISWLDDLYSISFVWRFLVHAVSAILVIQTLGEFRELSAISFYFENGRIFGLISIFFWIVWLTNAYNFMDGIDGIAGLQTVTAGIGWLIIGRILHLETAEFFGGVLAFSGLGFLIHNWQPAKIFMGDVGSAFLGYSFAALPILAVKDGSESFGRLLFAGVALVWLFFFDTIFTFLKRVYNRERVWQAHRSHIYQQLVINGFSHQTVAILYGMASVLNVILLIGLILDVNFSIYLYGFILLESIGLSIFLFWVKKAGAQSR